MFALSYRRFVSRIEAAPDQRQVAGIIVKKAFISEAGVIRVRLIERVLVSAHFAFDREHGSA
jgi:hypothetical protein